MKADRQREILSLIMKREIGTQEEILQGLREAGFEVTQATVSRDIREMKLTKVSVGKDKLRYVAFHEPQEDMAEKYVRVFREGFLSMDEAQNMVVVRTVSGMAMAVAAALDAMHLPEIVGCIAGDDTIFCAIRSKEDTAAVLQRLRGMA